MGARAPLIIVAILLCAAWPAFGVILFVRMAPQDLKGSGFAVATRPLKSGATEFRITRDLSRTTKPGRSATLEVRDNSGVVVRCDVGGERTKATITYRFDLGQRFERGSVFTLTEDLDDPAKPEEPKMVGGADIYEFHLADFMKPPSRSRGEL